MASNSGNVSGLIAGCSVGDFGDSISASVRAEAPSCSLPGDSSQLIPLITFASISSIASLTSLERSPSMLSMSVQMLVEKDDPSEDDSPPGRNISMIAAAASRSVETLPPNGLFTHFSKRSSSMSRSPARMEEMISTAVARQELGTSSDLPSLELFPRPTFDPSSARQNILHEALNWSAMKLSMAPMVSRSSLLRTGALSHLAFSCLHFLTLLPAGLFPGIK